MRGFLSIFFAGLILFSCKFKNSQEQVAEANTFQCELIENINDSIKLEYCYSYYPNGSIKFEGSFRNKKPIGIHKFYSEKEGRLSLIQEYEYFEVDDEVRLNQYYKIDEKGDTVKEESHYIKTEFISDSILMPSDTLIIKISLEAPGFKKSKMWVHIDIIDTDQYRRLYNGTHEVLYQQVVVEEGEFIFRGFVEEFMIKDDSIKESMYITFDKTYKVTSF